MSEQRRVKTGRTARAKTTKQTLKRLLAQLPDLSHILRGSLVTRYRRCGRSSCHCARRDDRGHGPAYYLMVTVAPGKTIQVYVPAEHREEVEVWIGNFRQARQTLEDVSTVNRALLREGKLFKGG